MQNDYEIEINNRTFASVLVSYSEMSLSYLNNYGYCLCVKNKGRFFRVQKGYFSSFFELRRNACPMQSTPNVHLLVKFETNY